MSPRHNRANRGRQARHSLLRLPGRCRATHKVARRAPGAPRPTNEMFSFGPSTNTSPMKPEEFKLEIAITTEDVRSIALRCFRVANILRPCPPTSRVRLPPGASGLPGKRPLLAMVLQY